MQDHMSRRRFIEFAATGSLAALTGCSGSSVLDATTTGSVSNRPLRPQIGVDANLRSSARMYDEMSDGESILVGIPDVSVTQTISRPTQDETSSN